MSYSFSVRGKTKAEVKERADIEFKRVLANQPTHKVDMEAAQNAANAFVDMLDHAESANMDIVCAVNGSVSWRGLLPDEAPRYTNAGVSVSVYYTAVAPA